MSEDETESTFHASDRLDKLEDRVERLRLDHQTHKTLVTLAGGLALTILGGAAWLTFTTITLNTKIQDLETRAAAHVADQHDRDQQLRETHDAVVRMEANIGSMNERLQNMDQQLRVQQSGYSSSSTHP